MIRRLFLFAYLTVTAFLVAHVFNAFMVDALTGPITAHRPMHGEPALALPADLAGLTEQILAAGLFVAPHYSQNSSTGGSAHEVKSTTDAAKKVKLVGTVVADGRAPLAIIEELTTRKQRLYKLREQIVDVGELVEIRKNGVMIHVGPERQFLEAAVIEAVPSTRPVASPQDVMGGSASLRRVVDRREIAHSMSDLPKLLSQARAVPFYINGKLDGWRIEALAAKSLFEKIGLEAGDVLQRVNGVAIHDPGMMLALLHQVKDESQVQLDVMRKNKKVTFTYDIR